MLSRLQQFVTEIEPFPRDAQPFGQSSLIMMTFYVVKYEDEWQYGGVPDVEGDSGNV